VKPRLLVLQFWGLGDLAVATPFLQAAEKKYSVTLVAKPFALELAPRLWPSVNLEPFNAPWTVFRGKYQMWRWPWLELARLRRRLAAGQFDFAVSARWDPRDHLFMKFTGARQRFGFSRLKSRRYLTHALDRPGPLAHQYEYWREAGRALDLMLPAQNQLIAPAHPDRSCILIHSGARLPARVWPLENFQTIASRLRKNDYTVHIACDPDQLAWWRSHGEDAACAPTVTSLLSQIDEAAMFIGNCSGPAHLAAVNGVPTFTLYGPSMHEWWKPLHPAAEIFEGRACPYKPCADYCRFEKPFCLQDVTAEEVFPRLESFVKRNLPLNGPTAPPRKIS
jgi:ADP-heptose:LPS heptosyltransferase